MTSEDKRLYDAALFRIRNRFTGSHKTSLTANESEVADELEKLYPDGGSPAVLSYYTLERLMRVTGNPDFFNGILSMQASQNAVRDAARDFRNWLSSFKRYKGDK